MTQKQRLFEFDGMRALAILLVLVHHLEIDQRVPLFADLFRYMALGCFVFISGYLLSVRPKAIDSWSDIKDFLLKRALRILPLYIAALLAFIGAFREVAHSMNWFCFSVHLLGAQLILSHPPQCDPIATLWYVGLIMPYYAFYALFTRLGGNGGRKYLPWLFVVAFPVFFALLRYSTGVSDKRLIMYFAIFVVGILSARYDVLSKITKTKTLIAAVVLAIVCMLYVHYIYPPTILARHETPLFSPISFAALASTTIIMVSFIPVAVAFFRMGWAVRFARLFSFLAYASYCMYLFHRPFWYGLSKVYYPSTLAGQQIFLVASIPILSILCFYLQKRYDALIDAITARKKQSCSVPLPESKVTT